MLIHMTSIFIKISFQDYFFWKNQYFIWYEFIPESRCMQLKALFKYATLIKKKFNIAFSFLLYKRAILKVIKQRNKEGDALCHFIGMNTFATGLLIFYPLFMKISLITYILPFNPCILDTYRLFISKGLNIFHSCY